MNRLFGNLSHTWSEIWKQLSASQRVSIVLIGILAVGGMGTVTYVNTRPDWVVAYADLEPAVAARVYDVARDRQIDVKTANGGRSLLVPSHALDALRMQVEREAIPVHRRGTGWELFDDQKLGMSEQQQQVGFQRAVQGELERMICEIPGVSRARVMLALPPQRAVFRQHRQEPRASVMVTLDAGRSLDRSAVKSIRHLVASAVSELSTAQVTITDNYGRLLAGLTTDQGEATSISGQLETQTQMEALLREKAEAILGPIVGPDKVVATVSMVLDMDRIDRLTETFDRSNVVVVSERVINEESERQDKRSGGVAGASANVVAVNNPQGTGGDGGNKTQESRKTEENQYLVPKTTEKMQMQGVRIKGLSVAVTIARQDQPRTAEELETLRRLVSSAVGAVNDPQSGRVDTIEVVEDVFHAAILESPVAPVWKMPLGEWRNLPVPRALLGLLGLGLLFVLVRRSLRAAGSEELLVGATVETVSPTHQSADRSKLQQPPVSSENLAAMELVKSKLLDDPKEVSNVLQALLESE